jgi:DNA-binding transcriptional LysR family regulator
VELRHLRYFVAVAEELHFGRAALRLHIAQPPLSQQIRRLEQDLGVRLFDRTRHRVELTTAGRAFLPEARRTIAQAEHAARTARQTARGELPRLAVGFVPSAGFEILPRVLHAWASRFPDVEIETRVSYPRQQLEALREDQIQVAFVRPPVEDDTLAVEVVQREPLVVALPAGHRLARRARLRMTDLEAEPIVLFPRRLAPAYHDWFVDVCRRGGFEPRVLDESASIGTNLGIVAAGLGVMLVPDSIRSLQRAGVV